MKVKTNNEDDDDNNNSKDSVDIIWHKTVIIRKREKIKILTWYFLLKKNFHSLFSLIKLFTLLKWRQVHDPFSFWSFSAMLLLENGHSIQVLNHNCVALAHFIKKSNNLKSVFCNTLLQMSITLQPKQNSLHISAITRKNNKTVHYVRDEILPQISNLIRTGVFL